MDNFVGHVVTVVWGDFSWDLQGSYLFIVGRYWPECTHCTYVNRHPMKISTVPIHGHYMCVVLLLLKSFAVFWTRFVDPLHPVDPLHLSCSPFGDESWEITFCGAHSQSLSFCTSHFVLCSSSLYLKDWKTIHNKEGKIWEEGQHIFFSPSLYLYKWNCYKGWIALWTGQRGVSDTKT